MTMNACQVPGCAGVVADRQHYLCYGHWLAYCRALYDGQRVTLTEWIDDLDRQPFGPVS